MKMKIKKEKKVKKVKVKKDRHTLTVFSFLNLAVFGFWNIAYIVCLILRSRAFSTVQNSMAIQGYTASYTVSVSSPMFGVLSFLAKLLPVFIIIWTVLFVKKSNTKAPMLNKWIIIGVSCVDVLATILACVDIVSLHMVFA